LTIPQIKHLLAALLTRIRPPGQAEHRADCDTAMRPARAGTTRAPLVRNALDEIALVS